MKPPVIELDRLTVRAERPHGAPPILDRISFAVGAGEVYALVGESGSGKTMTSRAILRLLPPGTAVAAGRILLEGDDLLRLASRAMCRIRGERIGMVFQEPMTSLNPALTVGRQLTEGLIRHRSLAESESRSRAVEMLERLRVPDARASLSRYPHEFSGGLRQRILIAGVLALQPDLLIADEPTTALDVLIQKEVLDLMLNAAREVGSTVLLITHDLAVVAEYADRVGVMRGGLLLEDAPIDSLLRRPGHRYTRKLLAAVPKRRNSSPHCPSAAPPLVEVENLSVAYPAPRRSLWPGSGGTRVLHGVDLSIASGETLAVVGESGSGKTTLAKAILRLIAIAEGSIRFRGSDLASLSEKRMQSLRRRFQVVFQDPYSSLDPRMRVGQIVCEGLRHERVRRAAKLERMREILEAVGLDPDHAGRFPHQLSGGQRQRVNIARALISEPELVVADEPVSALDVTVQAEILRLFDRLKRERGFACLFISHDLAVVEQLADRVVVIYRGRIVESGGRDRIFDRPAHPYTFELLQAAPRLVEEEKGFRLAPGDIPSPEPPAGHVFDGWRRRPARERARMVEVEAGHRVACFPADERLTEEQEQ